MELEGKSLDGENFQGKKWKYFKRWTMWKKAETGWKESKPKE